MNVIFIIELISYTRLLCFDQSHSNEKYCILITVFIPYVVFLLAIFPPPQILSTPGLGRHLVASRDLAAGEILFTEAPLVVGPKAVTMPVCINCYTPADGSYK